MSYTVKFNRGNRGWACSVFRLGADGLVASPSVATGTGQTKDEARDGALTQTEDTAIRAALTSSDSTRAYWVQGALGAQQEAQRTAAANEGPAKKRNKK